MQSTRYHLLGVKHPIATFHELITGTDKRIVYLAHPISEVRRLRKRGGAFLDRANDVVEKVEALSSRLRSRFTVLEPTAIDELRFGQETVLEGQTVVVPNLSWRWPLASNEVADLLSSEAKPQTPPFGPDWSQRANIIEGKAQSEWSEQEQRDLKEAYPLLSVLRENIQMQIKSRDFALVTQADGLVVYRPMFDGHESGGVRHEIEYHEQLAKSGLDRATTVVFHPREDEMAYRAEEIKNALRRWRSQGELLGEDLGFQGVLSSLDADAVLTITESDSDGDAGRRFGEVVEHHGLNFVPGQSSGAMGQDQAALARQEERSRGASIRSLRSYLSGTKRQKVEVIDASLSVDEFARGVEKALIEERSRVEES